ncbi:MAG: MFS transporter [Gammaproteobacteria bacterium]|nr:MFS transporter [Gammaproteobacteria bacterium]
MSFTLLFAVLLLFGMAIFGRHFIPLPKNIWLLFLAQPLVMAGTSMIVFVGGLLASKIAPTPDLATLPITLMILGTAISVVPAIMLMKMVGRRKGTIIGLFIGLSGAVCCFVSALHGLFIFLCFGSFLIGSTMAFVAQMRFAALESVAQAEDSAKAISVLMTAGVFAAILGPEVAVISKDWISSPHSFAGSFLALIIMMAIAICVVILLDPIIVKQTQERLTSRPISQIIKQPPFIIAAISGAVAYFVMSFIMTATPLSMHEVDGHDLEATKWVVQSHIVAMYLPAVFSALLVRFLGVHRLMLLGSLSYVLVVWFALSGKEVMHYWWAMVLLGVGWNFLFTCGTLILPQSYLPHERFKVQAINDFTIFFFQTVASLFAGIILFKQGWSTLIVISLPIVILMLLVSLWYYVLQSRKGSLNAEAPNYPEAAEEPEKVKI